MAHVLLVGRDGDTRAVQRAALEGAGYSVIDVADVRVAVRLLASATSPLVVVAEYTNLWSDGADFVEVVAADPALAGRHAYVLTTTDRLPLPPVIVDRMTGVALPVLLNPSDLAALVGCVERAAKSIWEGERSKQAPPMDESPLTHRSGQAREQ
jgi:CheY-like chemotaxis protein